jgi:nicotinamidase/pyrazinamidase
MLFPLRFPPLKWRDQALTLADLERTLMTEHNMELRDTDALFIIDLQNDFCPGGSLAVAGGDDIVPGVNALAARFEHVILTQDWHPEGHVSFASSHPGCKPYDTITLPYGQQTLWPDHCIKESHGAALHAGLLVPHTQMVLRKGFRKDIDSYSAFLENDHKTRTGLAGYLRERGLKRLFFAGLAFDFCVGFSAIDGQKMGFECFVVDDLTRPVALPGSISATESAFRSCGVQQLQSSSFGVEK